MVLHNTLLYNTCTYSEDFSSFCDSRPGLDCFVRWVLRRVSRISRSFRIWKSVKTKTRNPSVEQSKASEFLPDRKLPFIDFEMEFAFSSVSFELPIDFDRSWGAYNHGWIWVSRFQVRFRVRFRFENGIAKSWNLVKTSYKTKSMSVEPQ